MRFDFLNVLNGAKRLNCLDGLNPTVDMVGARHRFSTVERAFTKKPPLSAYMKPILLIYIKTSIGYVGPTQVYKVCLSEIAMTLNNLGSIQMELEDFAEAEINLTEVLRIRQQLAQLRRLRRCRSRNRAPTRR